MLTALLLLAFAADPCPAPLAVDNRLVCDQPDRLDRTVFRTPPDSLHLESHVPGNQYYRFPERAVRGGVRMRLTFHYLIAAGGGQAEYYVQVAQYRDTPKAWKRLSDSCSEVGLTAVGRWTRVDHDFTADPLATTVAVDFRVVNPCEVGEVWVDDISVRELGQPITKGP